MSKEFCVNKSGLNIPVYNDSPDPITQIGKLYNRESFVFVGSEGGHYYIRFLNSSGVLTEGLLIDPVNNVLSSCTDYPYGTMTIGITNYYTFIMRREANVYTAAGDYWGKVAANRRVACRSALAGDNHYDWKAINYVESSSGEWVPVTGAGVEYGFVDTGLASGSSYSDINMYGSW